MMEGPALLTGGSLLLYWGQVVSMATRARWRRRRPANFLPPERLGRWLRLLWQPVVIGWVAVPLLVGAGTHPLPPLLRPLYRLPALQWPAAVGVFGVWLASRRCWRVMGRSWRMGINPRETTPLVTTGPFAMVRHPIYALSQVMMLCSCLAVPSRLMLAIGVLHVLLLHWEAAREEQHQLRVHGPAYAVYRTKVGRFVPRRPRCYGPAPA